MDTKVNYTSPEALKGFEFVNELAKTCPKGFLEGRGAENFGTENNNIAMWYSQNLVSNYQKTESLGLTDRYGYAYSPVLENGREGWANFTGDWNMAIAKNAQNKEACWEFIKWMAQIRTLQTGAGKAVRSRITRRLLNGYQLKIFLLRMYSSIHWQLHPITSLIFCK